MSEHKGVLTGSSSGERSSVAAVNSVSQRPVRVAMFVLNPCHIDARVRKEAASLGAAGYEVRIFALGNNEFPEAVIDEGDFSIQRLEVTSVYERTLRRMIAAYGVIRRAMAGAHKGRLWLNQRRPRRSARSPESGKAAARSRAERADDDAVERDDVDGEDVGPVGHGDERAVRRAARKGVRVLRRVQRKGVRVLRRVRRKGVRVLRRVRRELRLAWKTACRKGRLTLRAGFLWSYGFVRRRLMPIHRPSVIQQFARVSARAAAAWQPDVCHAHDLNALWGAARVARQQDALLVYDSHELWRRRNRHGELRPLGRLVDALQERRLIRRVDMVITVSPGIRDWLQRQYRLAVPVEAVRNLPLRRQHRDGPPLRELAGVGDERVLMYTGRITSGRGLEETVDALPGLPEDVVLVMLGYGDDLFVRQLHHRADRRGVAHRVRQVPPVTPDQVPAVASQADCALVAIEPVCLSYYFALPNKLFEAVQAGLPVLASDLPDMRTIIDGYQVGRLFQTGRPGEVRDGISALLADLDLYKENADRAAAELTWEHESEVLRHAYARLTGRAAAMHQAA
jgi:glycosyltransferase involved in cell wall biosynthesis